MTIVQFKRTDRGDEAGEVLSIVKVAHDYFCSDLDEHYPLLVQITTVADPGDDFVGLYDLDGERVDSAHVGEWELARASEVPIEVIDQITRGWESGTSTVERLA